MSPSTTKSPAVNGTAGHADEWVPVGAAAKLAYIQSEMENVPKTGKHKQGYTYIQEHKLIETLRPLLRRLHCAVVVEPAVTIDVRAARVYNKPDGWLTTLTGRIRFIDSDVAVDHPDREIVAQVCGQGADIEDKGSGKAQTYLTKYAMQKLFLIPTEAIEDSDASPPPERQAAPATLGQAARDRIMVAFAEAGHEDMTRFLGAVGLFSLDDATAEHAAKLRVLLDAEKDTPA